MLNIVCSIKKKNRHARAFIRVEMISTSDPLSSDTEESGLICMYVYIFKHTYV